MKTKTSKPIIYSRIYDEIREHIYPLGYTISIHGSMINDLDLIAIPWTLDAVEYKSVLNAICDIIGVEIPKKEYIKPHNRVAYIINIHNTYSIDLSIIKPTL